MSWVKDEYVLSYNGKNVAWYYIFDNHTYDYTVSSWESDLKDCKELLAQRGLLKNIEDAKKPVAALEAMMTEENRVKGKKKAIYVDGPFTLTRIPQETGDRFLVYRCGAKKGENGYSEKDHSAPHYEGPKTPEGSRPSSWCIPPI